MKIFSIKLSANNMFFYIILFVLTATVSININAQPTVTYTLNNVIELAQKQSPDALIAKHKFVSSYWKYRNFRADYLPDLKLDASMPNVNRTIASVPSQDGSINYVPQSLSSYSLKLSLNQKIGFTGGSVSLNTGISRMDNFSNDTATTQYLANMVNIAFTQPIFNYNPYKWDKKIKPLEYEAAKREIVEQNEKIASTAVNYFFSLLISQLKRQIASENKANYDTLYQIAEGRFKLGKIAENDLLQLELNVLNAKSSVESTELDYDNSLYIFKSYLRITDDAEIELIPPKITNVPSIPPDKAVTEAKNNSSDMIKLKNRLIIAESEVNRAKTQGRFNADLYAVIGLSQTSDAINRAYVNPLDEEMVVLGLSIPILDWGKAKGSIKLAESNQNLEVTAVQQAMIDFRQNVFNNVMEYNMQKTLMNIAAKTDTVAQKRFEITRKRYLIGKINDVLELRNAQLDNDNAKVGYFRALMTYWKSYYEIRKITLYDFQNNMPITLNIDELIN